MAANTSALAPVRTGVLESAAIPVARTSFWIFAIASGIMAGGNIYESLVVSPLWMGSLPSSVRNWNTANPIQPESFWGPMSMIFTLGFLGLLAAVWFLPHGRRFWAAVTGALGATTMLSASLYIVPLIVGMLESHGAGLSDSQIAGRATLWVSLNHLLGALVLASCISAIRGLTTMSRR